MGLVSMKMGAKEAKEQTEPLASDAPQYPWDLQLHLGNEEIEKLGAGDNLQVGDEVTVTAKAVVDSVSAHKTLVGGSDNSADLQITEMAIGGALSRAAHCPAKLSLIFISIVAASLQLLHDGCMSRLRAD